MDAPGFHLLSRDDCCEQRALAMLARCIFFLTILRAPDIYADTRSASEADALSIVRATSHCLIHFLREIFTRREARFLYWFNVRLRKCSASSSLVRELSSNSSKITRRVYFACDLKCSETSACIYIKHFSTCRLSDIHIKWFNLYPPFIKFRVAHSSVWFVNSILCSD